MRRRLVAAVTLLLAATACRSDRLELSYGFREGDRLTYLMVADASAEWDIGGPGGDSQRITFDVTETVESTDDEGAVVTVSLTPGERRGGLFPLTGSQSFSLKVGVKGEVLEVLEVDGIPAADFDPNELALIATYRPLLPLEPVRLKGAWTSEQTLPLGTVFQQIVSTGRLIALDRDADGRKAELSYRGSGPLAWTTSLPQGPAELTGSTDIEGRAVLDLDRGFLREARSSTEGDFEVRVVPQDGQAPITGTLHLDLDISIDLRSSDSS